LACLQEVREKVKQATKAFKKKTTDKEDEQEDEEESLDRPPVLNAESRAPGGSPPPDNPT
jgi:hypothetical protein